MQVQRREDLGPWNQADVGTKAHRRSSAKRVKTPSPGKGATNVEACISSLSTSEVVKSICIYCNRSTVRCPFRGRGGAEQRCRSGSQQCRSCERRRDLAHLLGSPINSTGPGQAHRSGVHFWDHLRKYRHGSLNEPAAISSVDLIVWTYHI